MYLKFRKTESFGILIISPEDIETNTRIQTLRAIRSFLLISLLGVLDLLPRASADFEYICPSGTYKNLDKCTYCPSGEFCDNGLNQTCHDYTFALPDAAATSCESFPKNETKWGDFVFVSKSGLPKAMPIGDRRAENYAVQECEDKWVCKIPHLDRQRCPDGTYASDDNSICLSCPKGKVCNNNRKSNCGEAHYVLNNICKECPTGDPAYGCSNHHDKTLCPKYTIQDAASFVCKEEPVQLVDDESTHCAYGEKIKSGSCEGCMSESKYCPTPEMGDMACPSSNTECGKEGNHIYPSINQDSLPPCTVNDLYMQTAGVEKDAIKLEYPEDVKYNVIPGDTNTVIYKGEEEGKESVVCPSGKDCTFSDSFFHQQIISREGELDCPGYTLAHSNTKRPYLTCRENKYQELTVPYGYTRRTGDSITWRTEREDINVWDDDIRHIPSYAFPCQAGTYSNVGNPFCRGDLSGYHTYRTESPYDTYSAKFYCLNGYFCTRTQIYASSISGSFPQRCPPGTYVKSGDPFLGLVYEWQNCMDCPDGYYCPGGSQFILCPAGSVCRHRSAAPTESSCPQGSYITSLPQRIRRRLLGGGDGDGETEGQVSSSSCVACESGGYCLPGTTQNIICPAGYWCPSFTTDPHQYPIPRGKYYAYNDMEPTPATSPSDGFNCPAGHYCPVASHQPFLCPPGTYQPNYIPSLASNLECLLCPIGKYCSGENLEYVENTIVHTECTENMYCPIARNAPLYPPPGTVPTSGQENYQTSIHGSSYYMGAQNDCGERHQCTMGTIHPNQKVCEYGEKASAEIGGCELCSDGEYCIGPTVQTCPDYMYCLAGKAYDCPNGLKPNEGQDGCVHRTCPLGEEMGEESCEPCKIGGYCIENTRKKCDAGFYTPNIGGSKAEDCVLCELGSQCLENEIPESCPSSSICCGTYLEELGIGINPEHCEEASRTEKCPDGYLCAGDSSVPRMCPHGKLAVGGNSCVDIRSGMFTGGGESEEDEGAGGGGPCAPGYYCDGGSKTEYNKACDTGFENSEEGGSSIESCTPCTNGRYCMRGSSNGLDCPLGHYCVNAELPTTEDIKSANKEETLYPIKCEIGTYGGSSNLKDSSECSACEAGKACTEEGQENSGLDCEAGYYCSGKTKTTCPLQVDEDGNGGNICPPGGYCTAGVSLMTKCPEGKFNMFSGSRFPSDCQLCTPGTYCHQGAQTPTGLCSQGYYCPEGSGTDNNKKSSGGHFSRMGSPGECNCLKGEYSGEGASSCIKCPSGYFCDKPETTDSSYKENLCPAGRYCPEAATNAKYCGIGTYNGASGAESSLSCIKCESKKNCRDHGMKLPLDGCDAGYICLEGSYSSHPGILNVLGEVIQYGPCVSGYYCEENSSVGTKCGAGRYSTDELLTSSSECRECWNGYICSGEGMKELPSEQCEAGHTCERASKKECGKGHYCPEGSMYSTPCAPGHTTQSVVSPTCEECAEGSFCPLIDINLPPQVSLCLPGYLCPAATFHHKQHPCPQGSYKVDNGGFHADNHCTSCTPGKYCLSLATQSLSNDNSQLDTCHPGFYCLQGAKYGQPTQADLGGICSLGHYCPMNSAAMTKCPSAYYCDEEAMTHPPTAKCLKGHICLEAQPYGAPMNIYQHNDKGYICPQGMFCVGGETHVQCDIGTYNPLYGSTTLNYCLSCPIGSFCASLGLIIPKICSSGYYCPIKSTLNEDESQKCDVGKYCPAGTKQMISCPEGEYQDQTGQSECKWCSPGNICPFTNDGKTTQKISCPIGYMCTRKSMKAADSCLPGTYQDEEGKESCKTCDKGYYCEEHAMTQQRKCTQGFYCLTDGLKVPTAICPFGKMCPEGTTDPLDCPATKFCSGTGLYKETGMCPAGFYCPKGTTDSHANMCEAGHWCATGKAEATKCGVHTYNNYEGSDIIEDCRECPKGFICPDEGMSTPVDPNICEGGYFCYVDEAGFHKDSCTKGYKCPAGVRNQIECLPGTYQDELQQITCKDCEEGNYCDYAANHDPIESMEICPLGYYCPAKTGNYENSPCLEGTYGATIGLKSRDECSDCEENYLCMKRGQELSTTYPCRTGYVCNQKTKYLRDATECPQNMFCLAGISAEECDDHKYTHMAVITTEGESSIMGYLGGGGESDCLDCPPGYECSKHNIWTSCPSGYFCPGHGEPKSLCPAGSYCPGVNSESMGSLSQSIIPNAGDKEGIGCPRGTFSGRGAKICSKCREGKFCGGYMTTDASLRDCPAMFSCPTDIECPSYLGIQWCNTLSHLVGSYKPLPCPKGTYRDDHSISNCLSCQKGRWCWPNIDNNSNDQGKCKLGFICQGGAHNPTPFNIQQIHKHTDSDFNTYNGPTAIGHKSLSGSTVNIECPEGYFQNSGGGDACVQCPSGYKCPDTKIDIITDDMKCEEGKVCSLGTISGIVGESTVTICPEGFYCPKGTAFAQDCRDGMHTGSEGNGECEKVGSGKYRSLGVNGRRAAECKKKNTNCKEGSAFEPKCQFGTYGNSELSESCSACPAGRYCIDGTSHPKCTAGYLCSGGAQYPAPLMASDGGEPCPQGGFCLHGATAQSMCPCPCSIDGSDRSQTCCNVDMAAIGVNVCPAESVITCQHNVYLPGDIQVTEFLYFIDKIGAKQGLDCIPCAPGALCQKLIANPCPLGQYCPAEADLPVDCPKGTYSDERKLSYKSECKDCPEGYFCDSVGLATLSGEECSKGHYCIERMMFEEIICAPGRYRNTMKGERNTDCIACPAGYKCGLGSHDPVPCENADLCEIGTATPSKCPGGYYCNQQTNYEKVICPKNYYCPVNSSTPVGCVEGEMCEEGSEIPIKCVAGYYSKGVADGRVECTICPEGSYSEDGKWTECKTCNKGYVCEEGCTLEHPFNREAQRGYKCPKGSYCPEGSAAPLPCPQGTYNPYPLGGTLSSCKLCEKDMYNDKEGQSACLTCGNSAWAHPGQIDCTCQGLNRAFLKSDASCRCKPKYEFIETFGGYTKDSEGNSVQDCAPKVYERVPFDDVRDINGNPIAKDNCAQACNGGTGTRSPILGICTCDDTFPVDRICNLDCINQKPSIVVGIQGIITVTQPGAQTGTQIDMNSALNIDLTFMLDCKTGSECKLSNANFNSAGIYSKYGTSSSVQTMYTAQRRRVLKEASGVTSEYDEDRPNRDLQESSGSSSDPISDPLICINEDDTVMFEIEDIDHYPMYLKDSLLNTNPSFDYGAFKILASNLIAEKESGESSYTKSFAYTFSDPGNYVFVDSGNEEKILIVSVKKEAESCPDEDAYIQTRTEDTIATYGIALEDDVQLETDYVLIIIFMIIFIIMLLLLIFTLKYFTAKTWQGETSNMVYYRKKNNRFNFAKLKFLRSHHKIEESERPTYRRIQTTVRTGRELIYNEHIKVKEELDKDFISEDEDPENIRAMEELDLGIVDKIFEKYKEYKCFIKDQVFPVTEKNSDLLGKMIEIFVDMKFMLNQRYEILLMQSKFDLDYKRVDNCRVSRENNQLEIIEKNRQDIPVINLTDDLEDEYEMLIKKKKNEETEFKLAFMKEEEKEDMGKDSEWKYKDDANRKKADKTEMIKKLGGMEYLSDLERRQLITDYETDIINLEGILSQERALQEVDLRKMLREQRKRRMKHNVGKSQHIREDHPQLTISDETGEVVVEKPEDIQAKIEQQIIEEKKNALEELEKNTAEKVAQAKEEFLEKMGGTNEKEKKKIMKAHDENWQNIVTQIEDDRENQEIALEKMLAKRKQRLMRQLKNQQRKVENVEGEVVLQVPDRPTKKDVSNVEEDEIQQIIEDELEKLELKNQLATGSKQKVENIHKEENLKLYESQQKDLAERENEIEGNVAEEVERETAKRKKDILEHTKNNMRRFQDEKRKLNDKISATKDVDRRKQLLEKMNEKEKEISELMDGEKKAQDDLLKEQLARRKLAKMRKMGAIEEKMNSQKLDMQVKHMEENQVVESDDNLKNILQIVEKLQSGQGDTTPKLTQAQIQAVFDRMIGEKHGQELSSLLARQFAELEEQLRSALKKGIEEKVLSKEEIKKKYQNKLQNLVAQKSRFEEKELESRAKLIKVDEANELHQADVLTGMKAKKDEVMVRNNLEDKHSNEFIALKEKQINEKEELMDKLFGLLGSEAKEFKNQLRTLKEQKDKENVKKKKKIDLEKKLILEKYEREMENRFHDFDEMLVKQKEAEREILNKKGNIEKILKERRLNFNMTMKKQENINPNQQKIIMEEYAKNIMELEEIMEKERNRQYLAMKDKINKREMDKEKIRFQKERAMKKLFTAASRAITKSQSILLEEKEVDNKDNGRFGGNINKLTRTKLEQWKIDMIENDRIKGERGITTTYMQDITRENKESEGIYLQETQYLQYFKLLKKVIILEEYLDQLRAFRAITQLGDINRLTELFTPEFFDFETIRMKSQAVGGGYRILDEEGNPLQRFYKMLGASGVTKEIKEKIIERRSILKTEYGDSWRERMQVEISEIPKINIRPGTVISPTPKQTSKKARKSMGLGIGMNINATDLSAGDGLKAINSLRRSSGNLEPYEPKRRSSFKLQQTPEPIALHRKSPGPHSPRLSTFEPYEQNSGRKGEVKEGKSKKRVSIKESQEVIPQ